MDSRPCVVPGCDRQAAEGELCWACAKAKRRNGTTCRKRAVRHPSKQAAVLEAVLHLADIDAMENDAWKKAWARLWMAVLRYRGPDYGNDVRREDHTLR